MQRPSKSNRRECQAIVSQQGPRCRNTEDFPIAIGLSEKVCRNSVAALNQFSRHHHLRDLYKKHHWQVRSTSTNCTCCSTNTLSNRRVGGQDRGASPGAGGISLAMGADVAETTNLERPRAAGKKFQCRFRDCSKPTRQFCRNPGKRQGLRRCRRLGKQRSAGYRRRATNELSLVPGGTPGSATRSGAD